MIKKIWNKIFRNNITKENAWYYILVFLITCLYFLCALIVILNFDNMNNTNNYDNAKMFSIFYFLSGIFLVFLSFLTILYNVKIKRNNVLVLFFLSGLSAFNFVFLVEKLLIGRNEFIEFGNTKIIIIECSILILLLFFYVIIEFFSKNRDTQRINIILFH